MSEQGAKFFLDSNVILSGLLSSRGAPKIILDLFSIEVPLLKGMTGRYNLDEIERNLKNRFPLLYPIYSEYRSKMRLEIVDIPPFKKIEPLLGQVPSKDAPVLASARMGGAHYLVTGDKRGFPKKAADPIQVVSPSVAVNQIIPKIIQNR